MAVARLDAAASAPTNTMAYAISAGSNRLLVVAVSMEGSITEDAVTCVYGGQTMTKPAGAVAYVLQGGGADLQARIFYLDDAGIAAAANTTITATVTGATGSTVHAASYSGVDQTTPVPETSVGEAAASTPNPLTTADITAGDGSAVVALAANGGNATATWHADITEQTEIAGISANVTSASMADGLYTTGQTVNVECTWTTQNRAVVTAIELAGLAGPPVPKFILTRPA